MQCEITLAKLLNCSGLHFSFLPLVTFVNCLTFKIFEYVMIRAFGVTILCFSMKCHLRSVLSLDEAVSVNHSSVSNY